jgi:replicative DNA helicase
MIAGIDNLDEIQAREASIASAERALIATVLSHSDEMKHAEDILPQDFGFASHQILWGEILAFHHEGQLSLQAVQQSLLAKNQLSDVGREFDGPSGNQYLSETITYAAPQSTEHFAKTVLDFAIKRALRRSAAILAADCDRVDMNADQLLDKVESDVLHMRRNRGRAGSKINTILDLFETVTQHRRSGTFVPALTTHITAIQSVLKSYEGSDYPIIAARPGDGKSSIIRFDAFHEAMDGRPATIINLENSELEYARHLVSMKANVNNALLRDPLYLTADQLQAVKDAIRELKSIPLTIITLGAPTIDEVARAYLDAVREGSKSVYLDYIQLIHNNVADGNANASLSMSSSRLRGLALKHEIPLVTASQMSRNIVQRGAHADPELSDLRDSGSLEQDATQVLFPRVAWGPEPSQAQINQFPENRDRQDGLVVSVPMRVFVRKNRNGPIGVTPNFKWNRGTNNFEAM